MKHILLHNTDFSSGSPYEIRLEKSIEFYSDELYRYLFFRARMPTQVDDILQETFIKFYHALENGTVIENDRVFLFRIARNTMIDYVRKEKVRKHSSTDDEHFSEPINDTKFTILDTTFSEFKKLLKKFGIEKNEELELMTLRYAFNHSVEEIAERLEKKPNTIAMQIKRIRDRIKKHPETKEYFKDYP